MLFISNYFSSDTDFHLDQQLKLLCSFNAQVPCNPQGDYAENVFKSILKSLKTTKISDSLRASYKKKQLKKWKEYANREFDEMGRINRLRLQSMVELADKEMLQAMFESFLLFDVNPLNTKPLKVQEQTGKFDKNGKPVMSTLTYDVFQKGALHGVEGLERFLPSPSIKGEAGMIAYLEKEFSGTSLMSHFNQSSEQHIKAITSVGSLGGIGHKPDSGFDAHIIINTNPEFEFSWNDADFLVALAANVMNTFYDYYYSNVLTVREQTKFKKSASESLIKQFREGLTNEEKRVVELIFESSHHEELKKLIQQHLQNRTPEEQKKFFEESVIRTLRIFPDCEDLFDNLMDVFPFLKKDGNELQKSAFQFSKKKFSKQKLLNQLVDYYRTSFLDQSGAMTVLQRYAEKNNIKTDTILEEDQYECFLTSLANNSQLSLLLTEFIEHLAAHAAYSSSKIVTEAIKILKQHFSDKKITLEKSLEKRILSEMGINYSSRIVKMIEIFSDSQARQHEADFEYPLHLKFRQAEAYLNKKFPAAQIQFSTHFLRKQRSGQHTSFLVSHHGSKAYSLIQNDFLLNPATMMCGIIPMPFDLPKNFKVLSSIGVFPEAEWTLKQILAAEFNKNDHADQNDAEDFLRKRTVRRKPIILEDDSESFVFGKLPNWGEMTIPREMFLEHAIPIFLRESKKITQRNLPTALLNCWWLEMIVCIENKNDPPASVSRLLWNPGGRYFIREKNQGPLINAILKLEKDYPELQLDPWWLKFTEMLTRFEGYEQQQEKCHVFELSTLSEIQQNIVFCFAKHMRISDIINFEEDGNPIVLDEKATWRSRAMVDFYNIFFSIPEKRRQLILISELNDEACSKMEIALKQQFIESLTRVEKKLCKIGHSRALTQIINQLSRLSEKRIEKADAEKFLNPLLETVYQRVSIENREVLVKLKNNTPLNKIEQTQSRLIYEELQKLKSVQSYIIDFFARHGIKKQESCIRNIIANSKIKIAGDELENMIFQYHFERNFESKPYQLTLPFSKSLCSSRSIIKVEYLRESCKWQFSTLSSGKEKSDEIKSEKLTPMFQADLVEGAARCTLSGIVGFGRENLTTFEKPVTQVNSAAAKNNITGVELFSLAAEINSFFAPFAVAPLEMMENIHYIRDVLMICNVNKLNTISLIIRDNLAELFVINFDIGNIEIKNVPEKLKIGEDEALPRFFMRLNSQECRLLFMRQFSKLKVPLKTSHQPSLRLWVNGSNFNIPVSETLKQSYLNAIANTLWPHNSIGTREQLKPTPTTRTFDQIGKAGLRF